MTKFRLSQISHFSIYHTTPMPDPPSKKQKSSLVKIPGKDKYSIHEPVHELDSSDSESSDSSDPDDENNVICNRPEVEADVIDQEDKEEDADSDILLPSPPATISKKRKRRSKTKAICECYGILLGRPFETFCST